MRHAQLARDRRGTATIEFALILPIMVLLVMGLTEMVRRNLAMIDVDAAASEGADTALRQGFDAGRIAAAMAAQSAGVQPGAIDLISCGASNGKGPKAGGEGPKRAKGEKGGRQKQGGRAGNCNGLPQGRYARIVATTQVPSLFGPNRDPVISAVAIVRLP